MNERFSNSTTLKVQLRELHQTDQVRLAAILGPTASGAVEKQADDFIGLEKYRLGQRRKRAQPFGNDAATVDL